MFQFARACDSSCSSYADKYASANLFFVGLDRKILTATLPMTSTLRHTWKHKPLMTTHTILQMHMFIYTFTFVPAYQHLYLDRRIHMRRPVAMHTGKHVHARRQKYSCSISCKKNTGVCHCWLRTPGNNKKPISRGEVPIQPLATTAYSKNAAETSSRNSYPRPVPALLCLSISPTLCRLVEKGSLTAERISSPLVPTHSSKANKPVGDCLRRETAQRKHSA